MGDSEEVTMSHTRTMLGLASAATLTLLAAACGSTSTTPAATTSPAASSSSGSASPSASGGSLAVATTSLGKVLVDAQGHTLYLLTADKPGHSTCASTCLRYWPPATVTSAPASVPGVMAPIATTKTTEGSTMLMVGGWPLYTFAKDHQAGDVTGQGIKAFGGSWYAVSPDGKAVTAMPSSSPSGSGSGSGGGGYGY